MPSRIVPPEPPPPPDQLIIQIERADRQYSDQALSQEAFLEQLARIQDGHYRAVIHPLHNRGIAAFLAGLLLLAVWNGLELVMVDWGEALGAWTEVIPVLGITSLALAALSLHTYFKRVDQDRQWFAGLRSRIQSGGHLADFLQNQVDGR